MKIQKSPLQVFDETCVAVTAERKNVYGEPDQTYRRISAMRVIVDECPDEQLREVLGMIITKVARLVQTPNHLDSWIDISGYSRCGVMIIDKRENAAN